MLTDDLGGRYSSDIVELGAVADRYAIASRSFFGRLGGVHRADRRALRAASRDGRIHDTAVDDLKKAARVADLGSEIERSRPAADRQLHHLSQGAETDSSLVREMLGQRAAIASVLVGRADIGLLESALRDGIGLDIALRVEELDRVLIGIDASFQGLAQLGPKDVPDEVLPLAGWFDECRNALDKLKAAFDVVTSLRRRPERNLVTLEGECERALELSAACTAFTDERGELEHSFPERDVGPDADWDDLVDCLEWAAALRAALPGAISRATAERLGSLGFVPPSSDAITRSVENATVAVDALVARFEAQYRDELSDDVVGSWSIAYTRIERLTVRVDDVQRWIDYSVARDDVAASVWGEFVSRLRVRRCDRR